IPGTFGTPPSGYFIYDSSGHCSVQIMTVPPVKIVTPDQPTAPEALAIFNGYIAYYGTYTVKDGNIHQQVEGAWDPSQVGTDQVRPFELKDADTLIIGNQTTYRRTLKRVR
ncbi:MAG TPA: lipocalin-like domain-containing protein, partial [Allosphingosinicella sp.]